MSRKLLAIGMVALFLVGALAVIPSVSAQGGTVPAPTLKITDIKKPSGPVQPLIQQDIKVEWEYAFTNNAQNVGGAQGAVTLNFDVRCPAGVTVTGSPSTIITVATTPGATAYTAAGSQAFSLTVSRETKALETLKCTVAATGTSPGQSIPAPPKFDGEFSIQADYFGLIEAKMDLKLIQGGPQKQIPFEIQVTNFGNGQTRVSFEITESPSGKWQGLIPDPLLLDENGGDRDASTTNFVVATPFKNGWNNEEGAFTIKMTPEFTIDSAKSGSDVVITLVARVRGVYVPSLEPMIMVGAVIGTALVARMMRQDEE